MTSSVEKIGTNFSIFCTERIGIGRFGTVFPGKLKDVVEEVAIKRMEKTKVRVDFGLYVKRNEHPNIITYYGTDYSRDAEEFM